MKNYRKLLNQATADAISHSIEAIRHRRRHKQNKGCIS